MKATLVRKVLILCAAVGLPALHAGSALNAANPAAPALPAGLDQAPASQSASGDGVWTMTAQRTSMDLPQGRSIDGPHVVVFLNKPALDGLLVTAPVEVAGRSTAGDPVLTLPMPDGTFARFRIEESPMLAPELAAAFPEFRTYRGQGIDDPTATTRFGWTDAGFHAIVLSSTGSVYVDPYVTDDLQYYVSYRKADYRKQGAGFICLVDGTDAPVSLRAENSFPFSNGTTLRTYRLALAATHEYTVAAGGTKAAALSRMTTTMNRVNGIYERELAVRMTLATGTPGDPMALIFDTAADPYSNSDGVAMLAENQATVDSVVGSANYDIGHVFSTGGGGVAYLQSPCNASLKAGGVTGSSNPTGDAFDVDYVSHEMGHQFGGNHTFNGNAGNCGTRSAQHAYEVGSGSTIQAYAGICSVENLQPNSNDYFHVESLDEMTAFLTDGGGATCGTTAATGNTPPTVNAGSNFTIPQGTPFTLTASGSDANSDTLTYNWEEFDLGTVSTDVASASTDDGSRPLFRSYSPTASPSRTFPSPTYILNNANVPPTTYTCSIGTCLTGEVLPSTNRTMTFQVTARDNRSGGGGIATGSMQVAVTTAAGPFKVTAPNTAVRQNLTGGSSTTVTWDVAGTTAAPVSVANVKISLSTDGGATFPTVLAASTPNDGSQAVTLPNTATTTARIKVEAVGNIFFDVSDTNFTITAASGPVVAASPSSLRFAATKAGAAGALTAVTSDQAVTVSVSGGSTGWTASADQPWVQITNGTGTNSGQFTVGIINPGNVLGGSTSVTATVTIAPSAAGAVGTTVGVTLTIDQTGAATVGPFGQIDSPAQNATGVQGAIGVTGWALDDVGVTGVKIYRNCLPFDNPASCDTKFGNSVVFIGDAAFVAGARPDVEAAYPTMPQAYRGGWGYLMLTNMLPHVPGSLVYGGQGPLTLYAIATDAEGKTTLLGRTASDSTPTSITMANDTIAKPFGAIDTPGQGEIISGTAFANFGWVLTRDSNTTGGEAGDVLIPTNGSTAAVFIDGLPVATVAYNQCRGNVGNPVPAGVFCNDDVSNIFGNPTPQATFTARTSNPTRYRNLDAARGAIGAYVLNTTSYSNGRHSIAWGVTDSAGVNEGIGSRNFVVLNAGADPTPPNALADRSAALRALLDAPAASRGEAAAVTALRAATDGISGRTGFDLAAPYSVLEADEAGVRHVQIPEMGRLELNVGAVSAGYLVANGQLRDLPPGSTLAASEGVFAWNPIAGYLGTYRLAFIRGDEHVPVDVTIYSPTSADGEAQIRMHLDTPATGDMVYGTFGVGGWALDPRAAAGSGIRHVHVWAQRVDAPGVAPQFLGVASTGVARPDVARDHGVQFGRAGFELTTDKALSPGEYDITAYVWNIRTARWEDARTSRVTVK